MDLHKLVSLQKDWQQRHLVPVLSVGCEALEQGQEQRRPRE